MTNHRRPPTAAKTSFPETLANIRMRRGWSQHELAVRSGIANTTISRIESGHRLPDLENFRKLAQALEVSADELLGLPNRDGRVRQSTIDGLQGLANRIEVWLERFGGEA